MTKILVVDDAQTDRALVGGLLTKSIDCTIVEAVDGDDALSKVQQHQPDLVLTDLEMPGLNGLELVKAVREERGLEVPFLLLTARCDRDALSRKMAPYGVHLYAKPFAPSRLAADVDRLVGAAAGAEQPK